MNIENYKFPANFSSYLADLFREVRLQLRLTQEQMATILGTSQRVYQRWETGHSEPSGEFTAKVYLLRDFLQRKKQEEEESRKSSIKFKVPTEIADHFLNEIQHEDIHKWIKDRAKPIIILLKNFLWYAHAFGFTHARYNYAKHPIDIQWQPHSTFATIRVYLSFHQFSDRELVFHAESVDIQTNFDHVEIFTFYPGEWISIIKQAVDEFAAHSTMQIDDSSLISDLRKALLPDKS